MTSELIISVEDNLIGTTENVSTVSISAPETYVEPSETLTDLTVTEQTTQIVINAISETEIQLQENITNIITDSPNITGAIRAAGDISVPYLSSFKSENVFGGITNKVSLGLTDTGSDATGKLNVSGTNAKLIIDSTNIDIDASNRLELAGDTTDIFCQQASFKLGHEKGQHGQDLGARLESAGSPFTGIFAIENNSQPASVESLCPYIILEGRTDNIVNGGTKEFLHIGLNGTTGGNYAYRTPVIINPDGFGIRLSYSGSSIFSGLHPVDGDGDLDDASHSLGMAYARWYAVYAATSQIITSDRTHKQDIEELSEAEERVAVACKGLLRKFKLIQSVEEKGDNARIHFGIIAQDLQQAFINEGLDPAKYAMFCSDTWYEHDGEIYTDRSEAPSEATEVTQLGVRYEQLLAFIIASI